MLEFQFPTSLFPETTQIKGREPKSGPIKERADLVFLRNDTLVQFGARMPVVQEDVAGNRHCQAEASFHGGPLAMREKRRGNPVVGLRVPLFKMGKMHIRADCRDALCAVYR